LLGYNKGMTKRIFYYAIFLVGFLFVAGARVAQAVSLPNFSSTTDLPAFISSVYSFALTIVGIAVFVRILYAGFLMLTAAGNSSKWGDARTKMQNAVIGAILLFAAYMILYIINPDLVSNTFKFTIPSSSQPSSITPPTQTNPTGGSVAVNGMVPAGGGATSFHGLAVARAQEGIYPFTVKVTDRNGDACSQNYNIEVLPNVAAINADFYARHSVAGKYSASILNAVNAQEESGSEITQTLQSGGCIIGTKILPDAVENTPYYAEIVAAGEAPFVYEIENGRLPDGLGLVAALDMPVLTMKNITVQRTPPTAFKVGDSFKLELTNAKPNSDVYIKWFKNGAQWFYPGVAHDTNGWSKYAKTDANGSWVNQAAYTSEFIGVWQIQAMVDGKISKFVEVQVLAPEVKITVSAPGTTAGGGQTSIPSYPSSPTCTVTTYCENKETGETSPVNPNPEYISGKGWTNCEEGGRVVSECAYSGDSRANCEQYDFEARNCMEQVNSLGGSGNVNPSEVPHSTDGNPPADVPAGSLYSVDQYVGDIHLSSNNQLVRCRYSDQVAAVHCGEMSSGEHCLPDGRNAGWNEHWCAGQTNASGKIINPTPAPTPIPRGGTGGEVGPGTGGQGR